MFNPLCFYLRLYLTLLHCSLDGVIPGMEPAVNTGTWASGPGSGSGSAGGSELMTL